MEDCQDSGNVWLGLLREEEFLFIELGCLMGSISSYALSVTLILSLFLPITVVLSDIYSSD